MDEKQSLKKIVTIGGGTGQSQLLGYLKDHRLDISAVVSMIDDGGSTGLLRDQLNVLPPGDIRRCIAALATEHLEFAQIMNARFDEGDLAGHTVGNIVLAALEQKGSFENGVHILNRILNTAGTAIPVTTHLTTLQAELEDGTTVTGEANLDKGSHGSSSPIKRVWLDPIPTANEEAARAIQEADLVIYTIGDLFTSVVPNLLVDGIPQAMAESNAKFLYTCNQTSKLTETAGFTAMDYVQIIEQYSKRSLDYIIVNEANTINGETPLQDDVISYDAKRLMQHGVEVITADIADMAGRTTDGDKLAKAIVNLCQQL